ncbi:MAG: hypothetical protein ACE5JS_20220 [Nitrospinota bacterium]
MPQICVEAEENRNCPYSPLQAFETLGEVRTAAEIRVAGMAGNDAPHVIVGWSSVDGGSPCPVRYVKVTDSGGGASLLVLGGDFGIRVRPADRPGPWELEDGAQWGEACLLLDPRTVVTPLDNP